MLLKRVSSTSSAMDDVVGGSLEEQYPSFMHRLRKELSPVAEMSSTRPTRKDEVSAGYRAESIASRDSCNWYR